MSEKNLGGRPKIEINQEVFEGLCRLQCTKVEMCNFFEVDEKTLTRWCKETYGLGFSDIREEKASVGKVSLRRMQYRSAESGNVTMQIWLGKQWLDQTDRQDIKQEVTQENSFSKLTLEELRKLAK